MKENKKLEEEIEKDSEEKLKKKNLEDKSEISEKKEESFKNSELSPQEINALIEQFTSQQNQRFLQFLRDNTSSLEIDGSFLMKSLESELDELPRKIETNEKEEKLDYMKYEDPEKSKYKSYSPTGPQAENPFEEKSSSERIMEEQKRLTKTMFGGGYGKEENEDKYIKPEDIKVDKIKKYLS